MGNSITQLFQTKVVPGLYRNFYAGLTSAWMENNAIGVEYHGGKYVIMHELDVDGLGNYDRNLGYPGGNISGSKQQFELTMDRGREFRIDAADNDETGFLVNAAAAMAKFQEKWVIPEVDSYRYSKIYKEVSSKASGNILTEDVPAASITDQLIDDIAQLRDVISSATPLVVIMSGKTQKYFGREFTRNLDYMNFLVGQLNTKVKSIDGNPFMIVPSARLKTEYDFLDGITEGQQKGGFKAKTTAKDMLWQIVPATAPVAVAKIDKMRVFTPDDYQQAYAWKTDYRLYHDLWMTQDACNSTLIRTGSITE
nr:MAG TPA: major capsid protein [Caudoviricetes sp.]